MTFLSNFARNCVANGLKKYNFSKPLESISFVRKFSSSSLCNKDLVVEEKIRGIRLIGINRPDQRNCVNIETADALLKAFKDFDADEESKVAVLYGVGGTFCAGYDLKELSTNVSGVMDASINRGPVGPTRYETNKPVIGAIEGYAVAGGLELALWCDIRIVDETAIMGVFCRRWGVPLIDGGAVRLPSIVGLSRALDIILTGRPIKAKEALEIGLANQVVACGAAVGRAVHYAEALEMYPQEALRTDRNTARRHAFFSTSVQEALQKEMSSSIKTIKEAREGAGVFSGGKGRHGAFDVNLDIFEKDPSGAEKK